MSRYPEADLSRIRTYSVQTRESKVDSSQLYGVPANPESFLEFLDSLPDVLGARDLRDLIHRFVLAREAEAGRLVMLGAHVIKTGLAPGLIELMERGWITGLAMNGAVAIHDLELAFFGSTSEDVANHLPEGKFGMAAETCQWLNDWTKEANDRGEGLGEGLGRSFLDRNAPHADRSLLAAAYRLGVPATIHLSIGTDINHQHPNFPGAAAGEATARDFRILCHEVQGLARGVALNLGSAVLLPEVFLKAISVATNLGVRFDDITTAVFDFIRHYRPYENVVRRPTLQGGRGYYFVGQHEILVPLWIQALLLQDKKTG